MRSARASLDTPSLGTRLSVFPVLGLSMLALGWLSLEGRTEAPALPLLLLVLSAAAAVGSAGETSVSGQGPLRGNLVLFGCGALLLPAWGLLVLAVASGLPPLVGRRIGGYESALTLGRQVLSGCAAQLAVGSAPLADPTAAAGRLGMAALVLVAVDDCLIALTAGVAERGPFGQRALTGLLRAFAPDLATAVSGAVVALLWVQAPVLGLLGIGPLILSYVARRIPGLVRQSQVEPKTGLFNSVHFARELARALDAAGRQGIPVSVVMLDLDHLRALNNRVGHLAGDRAIAAVASLISEASLPDGLAARFGGEEFCLLLPGSTAADARRRAEAIRSQLEKAAHVWGERREPFRITISAGVASFPEHAETAEGLLEAADVAMYDAKAAGRNRVRVAVSAHARAALVLDALPAVAPSPLRSDAERVLLSAAPAQPRVTPLPDRDEARPVEPVHEQIEPDAAEDSPAGRRFVPWFVALLVAGTTAVALTASPGAVAAHTWLFLLLVVAVVALDEVSVDLFHSGNVSPGSVPTLALAFLFGPLGPIASEIAVALKRCLRREPPVRWLFDLGALGLAGAGAAAVFELASDGGPMGTLAGAALGGLAYYAVNIALLATVMALNEGRRPIETWRERLAWLAPHYVAFGLLAGGTVMTQQALGLFALPVFGVPVIMLLVAERQYIRRSRSSVEELRRRHEELEQANHKLRALLESNQRLLRGMHRSYLSTITSLARTIEAKDPYTGGHTERVARVACLLAVELGLSEREIEAVQVGGIIHDIGKVGVPDAVLLKPGRLTEAEFDEMRRHPEVSSYILSDLELPAIVKQMARSHHERYDGNGYPDRLAGEEIPLAARILTVADALDAMTSDRPYRSALPLDVAVAEIDAQAGRQFCPRVVAALRACLKRDATLGGEYRSASRLVDVDPFAADRAAVHHRSVQA